MSEVTEKIKKELLRRCKKSKQNGEFDIWNEHFDCIPLLFSKAYKKLNLSIHEGEEYIKKKLERDYNKLSNRTQEKLKNRYENIMQVLFVK